MPGAFWHLNIILKLRQQMEYFSSVSLFCQIQRGFAFFIFDVFIYIRLRQ